MFICCRVYSFPFYKLHCPGSLTNMLLLRSVQGGTDGMLEGKDKCGRSERYCYISVLWVEWLGVRDLFPQGQHVLHGSSSPLDSPCHGPRSHQMVLASWI